MYKNCQAWRDCGLPLSTTIDEAAKIYDAAVQQLVNRKSSCYGELHETLQVLVAADPQFVLGRTLVFALTIAEIAESKTSEKVLNSARELQQLLTQHEADMFTWEKRHARSALHMAKSEWLESMAELELNLTEQPRDMLALKLHYLYSIYTGSFEQSRDLLARVLPAWSSNDMEFGYLVGMYAFMLQETHFYERGKQKGMEALSINRQDTWAVHTMAHVYLMTGEADTGLDFMLGRQADWEWDPGLACHNFWHTALFHVEKGDFKSAVAIYDSEVGRRALDTKGMFQMSDGVALLYRLKLEGYEVGRERWADMLSLVDGHLQDHVTCFSDAHFMLAVCSNQRSDLASLLLGSMQTMIGGTKNYISSVASTTALPLCKAIAAFEDKDYASAVELLRPLRYNTAPIGGSAAQRDVFQQLLIHSALRSEEPARQQFARQLLYERKAFLGQSPLADRLLLKLTERH